MYPFSYDKDQEKYAWSELQATRRQRRLMDCSCEPDPPDALMHLCRPDTQEGQSTDALYSLLRHEPWMRNASQCIPECSHFCDNKTHIRRCLHGRWCRHMLWEKSWHVHVLISSFQAKASRTKAISLSSVYLWVWTFARLFLDQDKHAWGWPSRFSANHRWSGAMDCCGRAYVFSGSKGHPTVLVIWRPASLIWNLKNGPCNIWTQKTQGCFVAPKRERSHCFRLRVPGPLAQT